MNDEHTHRVLWVERGPCQNSAEIHWKSGESEFNQSYNNRRDAQTRLQQLAQQLDQSARLPALLALVSEYIPSTGHEDGDIWITRSICQGAQINWQTGGHVYNQSHNNRRDAHDRVAELIRTIGAHVSVETLQAAINEHIPSTGHEDGDIWITSGFSQGNADINWQDRGHVYRQNHHNRRDAHDVVANLIQSLRSAASLESLQSAINEYIPSTGHEDGDIWITAGYSQHCADVNWQEKGHVYRQSHTNRRDAQNVVAQLVKTLGSTASLARLEESINEFIPGTGHEDGDVWITSDLEPGSIRVNWQRDGHIYHQGQYSRETALTLARYLSTQAGVGCPEERLRQELDAIQAR